MNSRLITRQFACVAQRMVIRYALVGGVVAAADVVFFYLLAVVAGLNYLWINAVGFVVGTLLNYILSVRYVFQSGRRFARHQEIALIYLASVVGLLLNQGLIYFFSEVADFALLPAKLLTITSVFMWNYMVRKHGIFHPIPAPEEPPNVQPAAFPPDPAPLG
ncbi:membrane hypothetical protein [Gammaproteobacteria bacterium]